MKYKIEYVIKNKFDFFGNNSVLSNVKELKVATENTSSKDMRALIIEHLTALRRFAYSLTNDMHDADDLVQKVVEKLLKNTMPADVEALPWIFRVCKNAWIDELRSRKVRAVDSDISPESVPDSDKGRIDKDLDNRDLQRAIAALPEPFRIVIAMVVVSGMSYAETASSLDIPIGTVMSRVARARKQLSDALSSKT